MEAVDGLRVHHVRRAGLASPGNLQVAVTTKRSKHKPMLGIFGSFEQLVDCHIQFGDIKFGILFLAFVCR